MWPLVKAELGYQKMILVAAMGAILTILIFLWFSPVLFFVPEIPYPRRISITFYSDRKIDTVDAAVQIRHEGRAHQVISSDHEATLAHLRTLEVEIRELHYLPIEEIAVQIIKGGSRVAAGQS